MVGTRTQISYRVLHVIIKAVLDCVYSSIRHMPEEAFSPYEFITSVSMKSIFRMTDGISYVTARNTVRARAVNGMLLTYCTCH